MKVWSEVLDIEDLGAAARQVNAEFPGCNVFLANGAVLFETGIAGMKRYPHEQPVIARVRRIEGVHLRSRRGVYHPNSGTAGADTLAYGMAASWTEWGWWLARIFECDPHARCGEYKGVDDFDAKTNERFIEPRSRRERQVRRALRSVA
jgi:hypothetical protein